MGEPSYLHSTALFLRLLGVIYIFVFGAYLFQIRGLIGLNGILPLEKFLDRIKRSGFKNRYYYLPTIFWFNSSDNMLVGTVAAGIFLGALLALGLVPFLVIPALFIIQLSVVWAGQDFLMFGWEMFLLEITANAFLLSITATPNPLVLISLWLLIFRFHFQGGAVKLLSGDANWRNLTGVWWHYQSQPLPNTTAWFVHKLPMPLHKFSCFFMLFVELVVVFGVFGTEEIQLATYTLLVGLQISIWATGNFSYLNHLTVVLCTILLSDRWLTPIFREPHAHAGFLPLDIAAGLLGAILITLQIMNVWNHFFPPNTLFSRILRILSPFHLINRYGIFAIMTTTRFEIVVEGSRDGQHWEEYLFWYKPSEVTRRPRRISPYQPRIDWQAWFLPFSSWGEEPWFQNFLYHLLLGTPSVLSLIRHNPFPHKPPKYVRAVIYDYVYSSWSELKNQGVWWKREKGGVYSPILSLKETPSSHDSDFGETLS